MSRTRKLLLWAGSACVLLAVFALYLRPEFLMTLANQIWVCF